MTKTITISGRKNGVVKEVFTETQAENLFDLITKHDCYGIGDAMIKRIGDLQGFFEDSDDGKPHKVLLSNNTCMVVYNIASELLGQYMGNCRMTHAKILHTRRTRTDKADTTIGQNSRSDVMYNNVTALAMFIGVLSELILAGDSALIEEIIVEGN